MNIQYGLNIIDVNVQAFDTNSPTKYHVTVRTKKFKISLYLGTENCFPIKRQLW